MFDSILSFINRHQSFILITHDAPDADGIGAELALAEILRKIQKKTRIINSSHVPVNLQFLETGDINDIKIEKWVSAKQTSEKPTIITGNFAVFVLDTSEEFHLGSAREILKNADEVFIIDHHEPKPSSKLTGFVDSSASSTTELIVELACFMGMELNRNSAMAAYCGIVYDTGFFSYAKTRIRTFSAAIKTLEWGAEPNHIYRQLMENSSSAAILLQRQALANLEFHANRKIALMFLRREDFEKAGAEFEDVENIVNIPLRAKEVDVSILIREKPTGEIFCSLRSKGINVSKIAQVFSGGGHVTAAGFRTQGTWSTESIETLAKKVLTCVESKL